MKKVAIIMAVTVIALIVAAGGAGVARAQGALPPSTGVQVVNGPNPRAAIVSWVPVAGAEFYRVGWLAVAGSIAHQDNDGWRARFTYSDVPSGTSHTVSTLMPGMEYYFTVGTGHHEDIAGSSWEALRLDDDTTARLAANGKYDTDGDGLVEIDNLGQLDAIRYDPDGDGIPYDGNDLDGDGRGDSRFSRLGYPALYAAAFPTADGEAVCGNGCIGYELARSLDFTDPGSYASGAINTAWIESGGWTPIAYCGGAAGSCKREFTATVEGNGHTISNLHITSGGYIPEGLFFRVDGSIRRIGLIDVDFTGRGGPLAVFNYGTISDSYATGTANVGGQRSKDPCGLVWENHGTVSGSHSSVEVSIPEGHFSHANPAGLVHWNLDGGVIRDSYATGNIASSDLSAKSAGLVFRNEGVIQDSHATGDFAQGGGLVHTNSGSISDSHATGSFILGAGLVYENYGLVMDSHATGSVADEEDRPSAVFDSGGLVKINHGHISRSYATGSVINGGGLVSTNRGLIENSHASGNVTNGGGLVAWNDGHRPYSVPFFLKGTVIGSYATGDVTGPPSGAANTGGLVATNGGNIIASYATGNVTATDGAAGGLVGKNNRFGAGTIIASYSTGTVKGTGSAKVGGLVGESYGGSGVGSGFGRILGSYTTSPVEGEVEVGGLVGFYFSREETASVSSYWNVEIVAAGTGRGHLPGAVGLTLSQMREPTGYTGVYADWHTDLDNSDRDRNGFSGMDDFWDFGTANQLPALKVDFDGDGNATAAEFGGQGRSSSSPTVAVTPEPQKTAKYDTDADGLIEINYLEQLDAVRYDLNGDGMADFSRFSTEYQNAFPTESGEVVCDPGCTGYELNRSLDFDDPGSYSSGRVNTTWTGENGWLPIGSGLFGRGLCPALRPEDYFSTTLEGNGYSISNLFSKHYGLICNASSGAVIRGLGLVDVQITGRGFPGSLVGRNYGEIRDSYATGSVTNGSGLVEINRGAIVGSHADVDMPEAILVTSQGKGGLVGENRGVVIGSYATGDVIPGSGLAGINYGLIRHSHATGAVGGVPGTGAKGGLVGGNGGVISHSFATGNVTGSFDGDSRSSTGGLVGVNYARRSIVRHSYATGDVTGSQIGGLIGANGGKVVASYSTGDVSPVLHPLEIYGTGAGWGGGLVADNLGVDAAIIASYATGSVTAGHVIGGIASKNSGLISASYAAGSVNPGNPIDFDPLAGGLIGINKGVTYKLPETFFSIKSAPVVTGSYWDTQTTGQNSAIGEGTDPEVEGLTTADLQAATDYEGIYSGWNVDLDNGDNDEDPTTGTDDFWDFGDGAQYPALKADFDHDGVATAGEFGDQGRTVAPGTTIAEPRPAPGHHCGGIETVAKDGPVFKMMSADCMSGPWAIRHGGYYTFTLEEESEVAITAPDVSAGYLYLHLRAGTETEGDIAVTGPPIRETLAAGTYIVEVVGRRFTPFTLIFAGVETESDSIGAPATGEISAVGTIADLTLTVDQVSTMDVSMYFSDGDILTYTAGSSDPMIATAAVSGSMVTVTGVASGSATVTVTATDMYGGSVMQTFMVTVEASNMPPMAQPDLTATVKAGEEVMVQSTITDSDEGDTLSWDADSSDDAIATAEVSDTGMVTITGVAVGMATITVTATDMAGESAEQDITVTVTQGTLMAPSNVMASHDGTEVTVTWEGGDHADTFTVVLLRMNDDGTPDVFNTIFDRDVTSPHPVTMGNNLPGRYLVGVAAGQDSEDGSRTWTDWARSELNYQP